MSSSYLGFFHIHITSVSWELQQSSSAATTQEQTTRNTSPAHDWNKQGPITQGLFKNQHFCWFTKVFYKVSQPRCNRLSNMSNKKDPSVTHCMHTTPRAAGVEHGCSPTAPLARLEMLPEEPFCFIPLSPMPNPCCADQRVSGMASSVMYIQKHNMKECPACA